VLLTPTDVASVQVAVAADVPAGATVQVEFRSGLNPLDMAGWGEWKKLDGLAGSVADLAGRFVQVRITLQAKEPTALPALKSLTLTPQAKVTRGWTGSLQLADADVQKIVRSVIDFKYERPDQPTLVKFRKEAKLDQVVAGAKDDFEKMVKLMDWAGSCKNIRGTKREINPNGSYAWNIEKVFQVTDEGPCVYGHCMTYSEVMVTALAAMGYVGCRHMADDGFRDMSHEIVDAWVPSLGKWVHFDPSLTSYYYDLKTKTPLNLIEMHDVIIKAFLRDGEDMLWFRKRNEGSTSEAYARVREVGGKTPIGCRLGPWRYGEKMDPDYDWGWYHGYLAAGLVQMTPRNDFHSHPEAASRNFSNYPGYDNYPYWVDAKTPPWRRVKNWYTRMRDFYWTMDQASLRLLPDAAKPGTVTVLLGESMPFFAKYQVTVDGGQPQDVTAATFAWTLRPGKNTLSVVPVDEFGKVGLASTVTVNWTK